MSLPWNLEQRAGQGEAFARKLVSAIRQHVKPGDVWKVKNDKKGIRLIVKKAGAKRGRQVAVLIASYGER